jgi:hypothetical protein
MGKDLRCIVPFTLPDVMRWRKAHWIRLNPTSARPKPTKRRQVHFHRTHALPEPAFAQAVINTRYHLR